MSAVELHCHTTCSDGTLSPRALVERAHERGIRRLAITDHDTVSAYAHALPRARALGMELLSGLEISCAHGDTEIHLLGYAFDPEAPPLRELLARMQTARRERFERMLERLAARGYTVDATALLARDDVALGRGQLGRLLVEQGHVGSIAEVFRRLLGENKPCFVPKPNPSSAEAIALIHTAGGVAVLAHPGRYQRPPRVAELVAQGLDGIEVLYPSHGPETIRRYFEACARHDLISTGGSDFHGDAGRPDLGSQPLEPTVVDQLRERARRYRT